jgi:hypothetical protein
LQVAVAAYVKQADRVIDMAVSSAGTALMFMTGAAEKFAQIEKLIDEVTKASVDARDSEIASANAMLSAQSKVLAGIVCIAVLVGLVVCLLRRRLSALRVATSTRQCPPRTSATKSARLRAPW